jgi:hypothetical protein
VAKAGTFNPDRTISHKSVVRSCINKNHKNRGNFKGFIVLRDFLTLDLKYSVPVTVYW